jgi:hypothetical protein
MSGFFWGTPDATVAHRSPHPSAHHFMSPPTSPRTSLPALPSAHRFMPSPTSPRTSPPALRTKHGSEPGDVLRIEVRGRPFLRGVLEHSFQCSLRVRIRKRRLLCPMLTFRTRVPLHCGTADSSHTARLRMCLRERYGRLRSGSRFSVPAAACCTARTDGWAS